MADEQKQQLPEEKELAALQERFAALEKEIEDLAQLVSNASQTQQ